MAGSSKKSLPDISIDNQQNNEEIMRLIIQHLSDKGLTGIAKDIEK